MTQLRTHIRSPLLPRGKEMDLDHRPSSMTRRQFVTSSAAVLALSSFTARAADAPLHQPQRAGRGPFRVIIDTDPGVDDALALLLAMCSPELKIEAITAVA